MSGIGFGIRLGSLSKGPTLGSVAAEALESLPLPIRAATPEFPYVAESTQRSLSLAFVT